MVSLFSTFLVPNIDHDGDLHYQASLRPLIHRDVSTEGIIVTLDCVLVAQNEIASLCSV